VRYGTGFHRQFGCRGTTGRPISTDSVSSPVSTLSIITAVYNAQSTIAQTIDSVVTQKRNGLEHLLEHIIVDGLSTDGTLEVIEANEQPFTRVLSAKDNGIYDALNKGIRAATGDIIGFLHAGDVFAHSHVLRRVARVFQTHDVDCCYGDHEYVSRADPNRIVRYWKAGRYEDGIFRRGWMPPHPTFYARREVYDRLGLYDTSYTCAADYELMMRFLHKNGVSVAYIPEVLTRMRLGGVSNRSIRHIVRKTLEDLRAWRSNGLKGGGSAVLLKNVTKLPQFVLRDSASSPDDTRQVETWRPRKPR